MQNLVDFIKRNTPVFVIGFITLGVFLTIIFFASKSPVNGPGLKNVEDVKLISEHTPTQGPQDAPVVLVEFSNYECPACKLFTPTVESLLQRYPTGVFFAHRHFPFPGQEDAFLAARAAQAANIQGKFWDYNKKLFESSAVPTREALIGLAKNLGLDEAKFVLDLDSDKVAQEVRDDIDVASKFGVDSTPTFFLNNKVMEFNTVAEFENQIIQTMAANKVAPVVTTETTTSNSATAPAALTKPVTNKAKTSKLPILEIKYTDYGFDPPTIKAVVGQTIRWTNTTDLNMNLVQIIKLYNTEIGPNGVTIAPGGTFELTLTQEKLWTYKEASKRHYGSIFTVAE